MAAGWAATTTAGKCVSPESLLANHPPRAAPRLRNRPRYRCAMPRAEHSAPQIPGLWLGGGGRRAALGRAHGAGEEALHAVPAREWEESSQRDVSWRVGVCFLRLRVAVAVAVAMTAALRADAREAREAAVQLQC